MEKLEKALKIRKAKYIRRWKGKSGQWMYEYSNERKQRTNTINLKNIKKGSIVKYIKPGTTTEIQQGRVTGTKHTSTEQFFVIDNKINVLAGSLADVIKY